MARRYSLNEVTMIWGVAPATGLAKTGAVTITYRNDWTSTQVSGDGVSNTFSNMTDRSATIEVSISQTSLTNALWQAQLIAQEAGGPSLPCVVEDLNTGAKFVAEQARVQGPPSATFEEEAGDWTWTFVTDRLIPIYGDAVTLEQNAG